MVIFNIMMMKSNIKYLLPYCEDNLFDGPSFFRRQFGVKYKYPDHCYVRVWKIHGGWSHTLNTYKSFISAEEAKEDLDKILIDRGFYLINENEVERFEKKLRLLI